MPQVLVHIRDSYPLIAVSITQLRYQFVNVEVWCNWLAQQTLNLLERDRNLLPHPYALVAKCKASACKAEECRVESVRGSNITKEVDMSQLNAGISF